MLAGQLENGSHSTLMKQAKRKIEDLVCLSHITATSGCNCVFRHAKLNEPISPLPHIFKAVNELTRGSLGLVSHGSESDMIFFPWLRVKIKKSMTDL